MDGSNARIVGNYMIGVTIGKGSFGKVKLCRHVKTGNSYAIKIIQKAAVDRDALSKVAREIRILRTLNHPHIVRTFDVFNTPRHIYIVMEYVPGGELFQYILVRQRVAEREAKRFFGQTILGIEYCHNHGIVHRDMKPENLLLDQNRNIKMIDFGLSESLTDGKKFRLKCGSPHYSAPEMNFEEGYGSECDIFSAGVILFALICGFLPFDNPDISQIPEDMINGDYHIPSFISREGADLIHKMLIPDPSTRITIADIKKHPWLSPQHVTLSKTIAVSVPPPIVKAAKPKSGANENANANENAVSKVVNSADSSNNSNVPMSAGAVKMEPNTSAQNQNQNQLQQQRRTIEPLSQNINSVIERATVRTRGYSTESDGSSAGDVHAALAAMGLDTQKEKQDPTSSDDDDDIAALKSLNVHAPIRQRQRQRQRLRQRRGHQPTLGAIPEGKGIPPPGLFASTAAAAPAGVGDLASRDRDRNNLSNSFSIGSDSSLSSTTSLDTDLDRAETMLPAVPPMVVSPSPSVGEGEGGEEGIDVEKRVVVDGNQNQNQRAGVLGDEDEGEGEDDVMLQRFSSFQVSEVDHGNGRSKRKQLTLNDSDGPDDDDEAVSNDADVEAEEPEPFSQRHASFFTTTRSELDPTPQAQWWPGQDKGKGKGKEKSKDKGKQEVEQDQNVAPYYQPGDARVFLSNYTSLPSEILVQRVVQVLDHTEIPYKAATPWKWDCQIVTPDMGDGHRTVLKFTIEVCKLTRLDVHVVLYTRVYGNVWAHKDIASRLLNELDVS